MRCGASPGHTSAGLLYNSSTPHPAPSRRGRRRRKDRPPMTTHVLSMPRTIPHARRARPAPYTGPPVVRLRTADALVELLILLFVAEVLRELARGPMRLAALEEALGGGRLVYAALSRLWLAELVAVPDNL